MSDSRKFHPDNVFLVSGYNGTPDDLDANFVVAPNKTMCMETAATANKDFVTVSIVSLSEMRQIIESMEQAAAGKYPATIINKMFT